MPVALFTFHAYGSWMPDRRQGYVERGGGIQATSQRLAEKRRSLMTQPPMVFGAGVQRRLVDRFVSICQEEGYRPHAAASDPTHLHLLVSWTDHDKPVKRIGSRIKNLLALHLSRASGQIGRKWFSKGASRRQVQDRRHFQHLVTRYLPSHRGVFWSEAAGFR
ncbi:MAG: hypothetical protein AAF790_04930 [Planctomycetota bacterium]